MKQQDIFSLLSSRRQKFAEHLRSKGLEPNEAMLLRHSAFLLSDNQLALNAEEAPLPEVDEGSCTATFTISTYDPDRYGDVVIPKGAIPHLKNYRRNPRVFFAHKQNELPVGSCRTPLNELALQFFDDKMKGTCYFHCQTRESEVVFRLVARKELQAASIGFLPVKAALFEPKKTPNRTDTDDLGDDIIYFKEDPIFKPLRFLEIDLLEWSIVPIPANQEALAESLSRGTVEGETITPLLRKALEPYAAPKKVQLGFIPPTPEEINAATETMKEAEQALIEDKPLVLPPETTVSPIKGFSLDNDNAVILKDGQPYITFELLEQYEGLAIEFDKLKSAYKDLTETQMKDYEFLAQGYYLYTDESKNVCHKKKEDLVKEFSGEDLIAPPSTPEDKEKDWPLGAKFLSRAMKSYSDTCAWMGEMDKQLDQPRVKKLAAKKVARLQKLSTAALKLGSQLYPDKFSYEETPQEKALREEKQKTKEADDLKVKELEKKFEEEKERAKKEEETIVKILETLVSNQQHTQKVLFEATGRK